VRQRTAVPPEGDGDIERHGIKRLATESKSALQVRVPATRQPCFHVVYFAGFWHKHICTLHACGTEPTRSTFAWQLQSNMLEGKRPASNLIRTSFEPQRKWILANHRELLIVNEMDVKSKNSNK